MRSSNDRTGARAQSRSLVFSRGLGVIFAFLVVTTLCLASGRHGLPECGPLAATAALAGPFDLDAEDDLLPGGGVRIGALVDFRWVRTSGGTSWLDTPPDSGAGLNKFRFGGKDKSWDGTGDSPSAEFALPQISLLLGAPVFTGTTAHVQINLDADLDRDPPSAGVFEAFTESQARLHSHAFRLRLGAFVPTLSMEHPGPAWSTHYTITPSTIGSWAGEDLRALGAELAWKRQFGAGHELGATASLFSGSDQAGWVLLERGWALHDFQPDLRLSYSMETVFDDVMVNRPFREIDGRLGYYAVADLKLAGELIALRGGSWDNRGDMGVQAVGSVPYVFATSFLHGGLRASYRRWELLGQVVQGESDHRGREMDPLLRKNYRSWYAMAAHEIGRVRMAARYDDFRVDRLEKGNALTVAATYRIGLRHGVAAEYIRYETDHAHDRPPELASMKENLFSLNLRTRFGPR